MKYQQVWQFTPTAHSTIYAHFTLVNLMKFLSIWQLKLRHARVKLCDMENFFTHSDYIMELLHYDLIWHQCNDISDKALVNNILKPNNLTTYENFS